MTLQDWGSIGELVGGVAIIVSLLYVGLQIRQGTKATQAATNQAFSAQYSQQILQITREDIRDIFRLGLGGLQNLNEGEQAAFMALMGSITRMWETFFFERRDGRFDSNMYDAWMVQLIDLHGNTGVQEYWSIRKHQFTPEFVTYLDQALAAVAPKDMYPDQH
ncbi:MAG: hypothetical protein ACI88G_001487 [Woeseiaceae bacterium]|jgi:hypothetical protein